MDKELEQFRSLISPWLCAYEYIGVAAMGIHTSGSEFVLSARILLAPNLESTRRTIALDGPSVWAKAEVIPLASNDCDRILGDFRSGRLSIGGTEAQLPLDNNQAPNFYFIPGFLPLVADNQSAPRLPALLITGAN